ncbi:hypothetical protein PYW08_007050 [Mythimna loreyi]|uniref:Uncharacterized protein n=1 Tax=Mythimna loreyi TaxID=667449 RepID=A0ACC2R8K8_9NEOP|nr:hypothetical protein PYW08_007050 [Mythimna loreyi]
MESKHKTKKLKNSKFPDTPLAFYIKLFCKKKGSSQSKYHSNLIEATKSWLSLTEEEKQQVNESYKEQQHKFKQLCFDQLKNAEAFMKAKDPVGSKDVELNTTSSGTKEPEQSTTEVTLQSQTEPIQAHHIENDVEINLSNDVEMNLSNDIEMNLCNDGELETVIAPQHDQEGETTEETIQHNVEETPKTIIVEPSPPTLKSGKDLFYMLNPAGGAETVSWKELQTSEQNQYKRAVSLLKSDYIIKYRQYLESLTPRELYDYYNKTLF